MNESPQLPQSEEPLEELTAELLAAEMPSRHAGTPSAALPPWLRLAYAVEFLVALIAILDVWSEIGGQGHLDLMPWYIKLLCLAGSAWCCVRFTAALVEQKPVWTRRTVIWLGAIVLFGIAMGGITYYYHLHEEPDDDGDASAASVRTFTPGALLNDASTGKNTRFSICLVERGRSSLDD